MFVRQKTKNYWSSIGLKFLLISIVGAVLCSIFDGLLRGALVSQRDNSTLTVLSNWAFDFRGIFIEGLYSATIFFVGAKFFELRTVLTIGFDAAESASVMSKGPDDDNVVWIGRRYDSPLEAESVATALAERLSPRE